MCWEEEGIVTALAENEIWWGFGWREEKQSYSAYNGPLH